VNPDERAYKLEHAKLLASEKDAYSRLYYGLWIIFLGGFVLSLHVTVSKHLYTAYVVIAVFRILATAGAATNFLMQLASLESGSAIRHGIFYEAVGNQGRAKDAANDSKNADKRFVRYQKWLQWIGSAFLAIALLGSFLVHVP
jgi:hypothetical protein